MLKWEYLDDNFLRKHGIKLDDNLLNRFKRNGWEEDNVFFDPNFTIPWNQLFSHEDMAFYPYDNDHFNYVRASAGETPYYDYLHGLVNYVDENIKDDNYLKFFKDNLLFGDNNEEKLNAFKQTNLYKQYAPSTFGRKNDEHGSPYRYHKLFYNLLTNTFDRSSPITIGLINENAPDSINPQEMEKLRNSDFLVYDGRHRINIMKFFDDLLEKGRSGADLSGFERFLYNTLKETYSNSSDGFPDKAPVLLVKNHHVKTISIPEWIKKASSSFERNSLEGWTLAQKYDKQGKRILPTNWSRSPSIGNFFSRTKADEQKLGNIGNIGQYWWNRTPVPENAMTDKPYKRMLGNFL
jgi:hypothetical protein